MGMNKPTQLLKHDLKWASVDLVKIAERLSQAGNETDAWAVLRIVGVLINGEDRLGSYADEVKAGRITRSKG
ncbi:MULTISPECIES: hypothetical protein [unclassified Pseudomonas]|uniref:hypothetical protein n=1 Tax=unclassified Pseudomonas TaxID=196821 RepID=UPI0002A209D7|nr:MULTISPECIES: hypothetical protein [unclassified Pseudomonas]MBB1606518.1 hypothetical protein [Pseudomonas sp. UMC76]MBB1640709.1 hypothetical protein [Pseudomonas sp. UME83]NTX88157.1 hypothetical protein [Pseudomonas sp. UMA643]NTY18730.1 hypothetical protein [Pseudomonas sp. UMC3103]NTY23966.1 hypothetical protein [Pseudomonas sp. UMA603]